jgi:hypothetical protein
LIKAGRFHTFTGIPLHFIRAMDRIALLILLLLGCQVTHAQVKLEVVDSTTHQPVEFCTALVKGTLNGATADAQGRLTIRLVKPPVKVVVSALGYFTREIELKDTLGKVIVLVPKPYLLNTVTVGDERVETLQQKSKFYYLDFDFYDDYILALAGIPGSRMLYLQMMTAEGELVTSLGIGSDAEKIFKDCIGNLHVLTPDSSYQVYYDYERLRLMPPYAIAVFNQYLRPCLCCLDSTYYFSQYSYRGLKLAFSYIKESEKGRPYPLRTVADSVKISDFNQQYDLNYFLEQRRKQLSGDYNTSVDEMKKNLDYYRENLKFDEATTRWLAPAEAELLKIKDHLYLFSFTDSLLFAYNRNDSCERTVPFVPHRNRHLRHTVYLDASSGQTFMIAQKDGRSVIYRIDKKSGLLENGITIPDVMFIRNIKIRDGVMYFLYRDRLTDKPAKISRYRIN